MALDTVDELDQALLHALQVSPRASFRLVGEVLGVSDQTVARRYARLRSEHALRVRGLSDPAALGWASWVLRVRAAPHAAAEIADAVARRADTSWISLCSGGAEIVATVRGPGVESLLLDVLPRTPGVLDVRADEVLRVFYGGLGEPFTKQGPLEAAQVSRLSEELPVPGTPPTGLDTADRAVLEALRNDGRASIETVTSRTGLSASTVRRRLHELRAGGVLRLVVDVDLSVFELPVRSMLWLTVEVGALEEVGSRLGAQAEVAFAAATTGRANVFVSVSTHDGPSLYRYLTRETAALPGVLAVETAPVVRHLKSASSRYRPRLAPPAPARGRTP